MNKKKAISIILIQVIIIKLINWCSFVIEKLKKPVSIKWHRFFYCIIIVKNNKLIIIKSNIYEKYLQGGYCKKSNKKITKTNV